MRYSCVVVPNWKGGATEEPPAPSPGEEALGLCKLYELLNCMFAILCFGEIATLTYRLRPKNIHFEMRLNIGLRRDCRFNRAVVPPMK